MVEVFKTNVSDEVRAEELLHHIHQAFEGYKANFDLEDCDRILRVETVQMPIQSRLLIQIIENMGFCAEVLEEDVNLTVSVINKFNNK